MATPDQPPQGYGRADVTRPLASVHREGGWPREEQWGGNRVLKRGASQGQAAPIFPRLNQRALLVCPCPAEPGEQSQNPSGGYGPCPG